MTPAPHYPLRFTTARLVLREVSMDDLAAAHAIDADPEVTRYTSHEGTDLEASRAFLERTVRHAQETPRRVFDFALTRPGEDRYLGHVGFNVERPAHHEAMVWFLLERASWGQGLVTEAMTPVLDLAFDTLGLHRVFGDADPRNLGSRRVMEKLGFTREAHLRENWWLKGEWCDSLLYGLLDREWRARRATNR